MGRSQRTLDWYRQKMGWYMAHGQAPTLAELTAFELKRYLAELQARGLADNTVHGHFEVLKAFANWAFREGYPVDAGLLKVRAPKVAQQEMETYTSDQQAALLRAAAPGWARMAVATVGGRGRLPTSVLGRTRRPRSAACIVGREIPAAARSCSRLKPRAAQAVRIWPGFMTANGDLSSELARQEPGRTSRLESRGEASGRGPHERAQRAPSGGCGADLGLGALHLGRRHPLLRDLRRRLPVPGT
jgi:hypothetical protein